MKTGMEKAAGGKPAQAEAQPGIDLVCNEAAVAEGVMSNQAERPN